LFGLEIPLGKGLEFFPGDGFDGGENFVERIEATEVQLLAGRLDMRELVDSSESMSEPLR